MQAVLDESFAVFGVEAVLRGTGPSASDALSPRLGVRRPDRGLVAANEIAAAG